MSETLILLLGHSPEEPIYCAFLDGTVIKNADEAKSIADLDEIAPRALSAQQIVAVLPGEDVAMRAMPSPPRVAAKFKAAASYLLEDELAENLETLHIAIAKSNDGVGLAYAVKKSLMELWAEAFRKAGMTPDIMTPDFALLASHVTPAKLIFAPLRMVAAIADHGFAAERPVADLLVKQILDGEEITSASAYGDPESETAPIDGLDIDWRGESDRPSQVTIYAEGLAEATPVNLLQGEFKRKTDWRSAIGEWRRPAMAAAACLVALLGTVIADGMHSSREADKLNQQARIIHNEAFSDKLNVNPRDHARQILAQEAPQMSFLRLATAFSKGLEESGPIQVDRVRFNADRGEFSINLRFSAIDDLERLKAILATQGISASEVGGVRRAGSSYVGELRVSAS